MGQPVALRGHMHTCPSTAPRPHVGGPVVQTQQTFVTVDGVPIATVGDTTMCTGVPMPAKITSGSAMVSIEGKKMARITSACEHGGTVVQGVTWMTTD